MPRIIPTMTKLGYSPNKTGVCYGIAAMGAQAVIREKPKAFFERIVRIHNLSKENIATITKERELGKVDDLYYFFDGLATYHGPGALAEEFHEMLPKHAQGMNNCIIFKDENHSDLIESNEFNFADIKEKFVCSLTAKELKAFVLELKSQLKDQPFSLLLNYASPAHTTQLGFSNDHWLTIDHDRVNIFKDDNENKLEKIIRNVLLKPRALSKNHKFSITLDVLLLEQTNTDLSFTRKYELTDQKIIKLKKDKKSIRDLMLSCIYAKNYALLIKILELVNPSLIIEQCVKNDISLLHTALSDGKTEVVDAFIKIIEKLELLPDKRASLLKAETKTAAPGLYLAAQEGHTETVKLFLQAIAKAKLTSQQKISLFEAKTKDGTPALLKAAHSGHAETVNAFIEAIKHSDFSLEQKVLLLSAKDQNGVSALFMAAYKGHIDTVNALLQAINDIDLPLEQKVSLLQAKDNSDISALFMAAHNGYATSASALFHAIDNANLPLTQKMSLLQAKDRKGAPALFMAAKNGHTATVNALLQAIIDANLPLEQKMSLLEAKDQFGATASFAAKQNNYFEIVNAFTQAIEKVEANSNERIFFDTRL